MTLPLPVPGEAWQSIAWALLIGLLVGAQREASLRGTGIGVRDFLVISVTGCVCGLTQSPWLGIGALLGVIALQTASLFRPEGGGGLTTELAALAVFCLGYAAALPQTNPQLVVALAVILTLILEAKRSLHKFFRETITEVEFNDSVKFLALVFVIYPLLPDARFGPYEFFHPRQAWMFVILVSSISWLGYFLEKFLGPAVGLPITGLASGLSSTTAATIAFAKDARAEPGRMDAFWQAATLSNLVQFPRILVLLALTGSPLAAFAWKPMAAMTACGIVLATLIRPKRSLHEETVPRVPLRNPFTLAPALQFGAAYVAIVFLSRALPSWFGASAITWTSAIAGLADVDAITVSLGELTYSGGVEPQLAGLSLWLAILMNGLVKTGISFTAGGPGFAWRIGTSLGLMLAAGLLATLAQLH